MSSEKVDILFDLLALVVSFFSLPSDGNTPEYVYGHGVDLNPAEIRVVDGDTIAYEGNKIRLVGFDTPETFRPGCDEEKRLGQTATARVKELVATSDVITVELSGRTDKYGRSLGKLFFDGEDVGAILVREHLALPYGGGRRESWCQILTGER